MCSYDGPIRSLSRAPALLALLVAVALLAGCSVPPPEGNAPLRYRDLVFANVNVTRDLSYGRAPDNAGNPVDLKLDLYQPAGDTVARRPAMVFVHGGGFITGDKASGESFVRPFVQRGYVAVSINYRLLAPPGCAGVPDPAPACLTAATEAQHDAQAAVRWLRANAATYRIDPERIAMAGNSAGAITSLLAGWRSEDPGSSGNPGRSSAIRAAVSIAGGTPTNEAITAGDAPAIFFHGTEDRTVAYNWAVNNAAAMYNLGLPVVLQSFEGAGHGVLGRYGAQIDEQTRNFLYIFLDLGRAAGQPAAAARAADARLRSLERAFPEVRVRGAARSSRRGSAPAP